MLPEVASHLTGEATMPQIEPLTRDTRRIAPVRDSSNEELELSAPPQVVTDLEAVWRLFTDAIRTAGTLTVPHPVRGPGPWVDCGGDVDLFAAVLRSVGPRLVYTETLTWTPEHHQILVGTVELNGSGDGFYPVSKLLKLYAQQTGRYGQLLTAQVTLVVDGVSHRWAMTADWHNQLSTSVAEALAESTSEEAAGWDREDAALEAVQAEQDAYLADLADLLISDDNWLMLTNERTRRAHADRLVRDKLGAEMLSDAAVRGKINSAVKGGEWRRKESILPAHHTAFRERIEEHAAALAGSPTFVAATTKDARLRASRELMNSLDPLVTDPTLTAELAERAMRVRAGEPVGETALFAS